MSDGGHGGIIFLSLVERGGIIIIGRWDAAEDDVPVRKGRVYTRVTGDSTSGETRRLPNHLND